MQIPIIMENNANNTRIITWNASGIRNKYLELFQFLTSRSIHICLISETGLNSNLSITNNEFKINVCTTVQTYIRIRQ